MGATVFSGIKMHTYIKKMHTYKKNVMGGPQLEGSQGERLRTNLLSVEPVETTTLSTLCP